MLNWLSHWAVRLAWVPGTPWAWQRAAVIVAGALRPDAAPMFLDEDI
ncbi:MAG: hypothetical protein Q8P50_15640 [Bacillota bacterium]|nr:hypothetical protein [Bacillota bacterium]